MKNAHRPKARKGGLKLTKSNRLSKRPLRVGGAGPLPHGADQLAERGHLEDQLGDRDDLIRCQVQIRRLGGDQRHGADRPDWTVGDGQIGRVTGAVRNPPIRRGHASTGRRSRRSVGNGMFIMLSLLARPNGSWAFPSPCLATWGGVALVGWRRCRDLADTAVFRGFRRELFRSGMPSPALDLTGNLASWFHMCPRRPPICLRSLGSLPLALSHGPLPPSPISPACLTRPATV